MAFKSIYLLLAEKQLNLMAEEYSQLSQHVTMEDLKKLNKEELIYLILRSIANKKIISIHYSVKEAKNLLKLIDK